MAERRVRLLQVRKAAGLTQEELAYRLGVDRSTVGRWETGVTEPSVWLRPKLAQLLGISRAELGAMLTPHHRPEPDSVSARLSPPADEREHLRLALRDANRYLDASIVDSFSRQLGVAMFDDGIGGPSRTLPTVLGLIQLVENYAREVKSPVRRALLRVGARGAEFAGFLYRDIYSPDLALYWRDRAAEWALEAGEWAMQGYILLKKSQSAWDDRDAARMLTLAQAAQNGPWTLPPLVRAEAAQQEARGLAMTEARSDAVSRKLDEAHELVDAATADDRGPDRLGNHYSLTLLTMQTAICYCEAGQLARAVEIYTWGLASDRFSYRDHGYFLSLQAGALALAGEPDSAANTASEALAVARQTDSKRTMRELVRVSSLLTPWRSRPTVRDFADQLSG